MMNKWYMVLKMGKFYQIHTELLHLIYVKILFPGSILSIY